MIISTRTSSYYLIFVFVCFVALLCKIKRCCLFFLLLFRFFFFFLRMTKVAFRSCLRLPPRVHTCLSSPRFSMAGTHSIITVICSDDAGMWPCFFFVPGRLRNDALLARLTVGERQFFLHFFFVMKGPVPVLSGPLARTKRDGMIVSRYRIIRSCLFECCSCSDELRCPCPCILKI